MKTDIVIGAVGDYHYDQIKFWVNSLKVSGFKGRKILLSYNSNPDLVTELTFQGIEVYDMDRNMFAEPVPKFESHTGKVTKENTDILVHHVRFYHMWQLINQLGKHNIGNVIHTDVRDVVFQTNPSEWLDNFGYTTEPGRGKNVGKTIIAPSEYLTYAEEPWNRELGTTNFGPYVYENILKGSLVYNVGSFAAEVDDFLNLSLMTYLLCYRRNKLADQPSQAILFNTVFKDKVYTAETKDAWALQCGTLLENHVRFKDQLRGKLPAIKDGKVVNEEGTPYVIVHQYDRVPEFKTLLEYKYQ